MSYGLAVSVADVRADELKRFRELLSAMVRSDLPGCINPRDYANARRTALPEMWSHNPARAFLRLTDADQRKVLDALLDKPAPAKPSVHFSLYAQADLVIINGRIVKNKNGPCGEIGSQAIVGGEK